MQTATHAATVSVVVPVWREGAKLIGLVEAMLEWPEVREVIVSVAEETRELREDLEAAGALCVAAGRPSRGRQLNLGARHARGEWLLFHHADTEISREHVQALAALTTSEEIVGGAFYRKFDARHPHCRWIEPIERFHNRNFGALFGDQSLFARRAHFEKVMGGFADIPLMEDVEFSKRLRRSGKLALLDPPIATSPRKHQHGGPWLTTFTNAALIALYHLGVSPDRLHAWYYRTSDASSAASPVLSQTNEN